MVDSYIVDPQCYQSVLIINIMLSCIAFPILTYRSYLAFQPFAQYSPLGIGRTFDFE